MRRIAIALTLTISLFSTGANAAHRAEVLRTSVTTSGFWAVQALGLNQSPSNSPYTITWVVSSGTAYSFFSFRNTGSFTVNGFEVFITQVQLGGSGKPNDTTFELCNGGSWNSTTNLCSGTPLLIGTSADTSLLFSGISLPANSDLSMRASTKPNLKNAFTTTLSVNVNRSNIRAAGIQNS